MLKNTALIFASTIFALLLAELVLQIVAHNPNYYFSHRYLFATANYARNVHEEFWVYEPNNRVREVVVYGFPDAPLLPGDHYRIEYQCQFNTNNIGLIQDRDVSTGEKITLIVGDSFTAGHGGCPWFPRLLDTRPGENLVNGGLMGTGVIHWKHLVDYIMSRGIKIERIVMIAITNDFKREPWVWTESQLDCLNNGTCSEKEYWRPIELKESDAEILARAVGLGAIRHGQVSAARAIEQWAMRNIYTMNLVVRTWRGFKNPPQQSKPHAETLTALSGLKALGIPLEVLMVTQKNEVGIFPRGPDAGLAESLLEQVDIAFRWCELTPADFMPVDSHPNRQGYDRLIECVSEILDES